MEGDELNLPLAQESWAYSSSPAAASMGRKSSSKVRESEKYQLKSWWSPIWCRIGATTFRTGGSDHADAVRSLQTVAGVPRGNRHVPVERLARVGVERRRRLSADQRLPQGRRYRHDH